MRPCADSFSCCFSDVALTSGKRWFERFNYPRLNDANSMGAFRVAPEKYSEAKRKPLCLQGFRGKKDSEGWSEKTETRLFFEVEFAVDLRVGAMIEGHYVVVPGSHMFTAVFVKYGLWAVLQNRARA